MPIISKIKLPDNITYDITDGRGMFVGGCSTAASAQIKEVSISSDQNFELRLGAVIAVKFTYSNTYKSTTAAPCKMNVNGTGAKNIYYQNTSALNNSTATTAFGLANYYHFYLYDGSYWVWVGYSNEANTTYSGMTTAEIEAGTSTSNRLISPANLKTAIGTWETVKAVDTSPTKGSNNPIASDVVYDMTEIMTRLAEGRSKNIMQLTTDAGAHIHGYGIDCDIDPANGIITLNGFNTDKKCTGPFNVQIAKPSKMTSLTEGVYYRFICDGHETSNDTLGIYVYTSGLTPYTQWDCFENPLVAWNPGWNNDDGTTAAGFRLFIRSGTVVDNIILKPMICLESDYKYAPLFEAYHPTLSEMYQMILDLQSGQ